MNAVKSHSEVPLERLEHEIATLAAHIYAATCRWLLMIAEFDRRQGWASWGMTSCAEWLAFKCSLSPRTAREHVRVANALAELPLITAAFAAGELSYSKVKALTRMAAKETEEDLMAIARHCSAAQLDKLAMHYRRGSAAEELAETNRRHRDRYVSWNYDEYGMVKIQAYLDPEEGALVAEALEVAVDATRVADKAEAGPAGPQSVEDEDVPQAGSAEPQEDSSPEPPEVRLPDAIHFYADPERSFLQRAADGLVMIAETYLEAGPMARKGGDRYQVLIHVDHRELTEAPGEPDDTVPRDRPHLEDGPGLARETIDRILCDCSVVEMVEKNGEPLSVGRKTRSIPTAIRRALQVRDAGCRWPGCNRKLFVDGHHVDHWTKGGETKLKNLMLLCRIHHRMVHEDGFRVVLGPNGEVTVYRPDEIEIPKVALMFASGEDLEERNAAFEVSVDDETCMTLDHATLDHGAMVESLRTTERLAGEAG